MNKLSSHSILFQENFIALIGVLLCLYFSYHAISGQRSLFKLLTVNHEITEGVARRDNAIIERLSVEQKVHAMRPGSVNRDLLEERVRVVLGYTNPDEIVILRN